MGKTGMDGLAAELFDGRRWGEDDARRVLVAWKASGESVAEFADRLGMDSQRLYWWRRRLRDESELAAPTASGKTVAVASRAFVPVTVRGTDARTRHAAAVVVSVDAVHIEVCEVDAATAGWVSLLVTSLVQARS